MNSYIYGRFQWVACHECELGGNSLALCEIGLKVTTEKSNYFKRGCWNGVLMEKYRNAGLNRKNRLKRPLLPLHIFLEIKYGGIPTTTAGSLYWTDL